ncbi:PPOX class F420-dependent oxidoreductase [Streptomyces sp. NPDC096030]|uniref:PPOX class F420-dependent oxidoreductase n=1 Tax=Streptomyces sp. NPDC096030 TaxID=3155423 RepID=UPI00331F6460
MTITLNSTVRTLLNDPNPAILGTVLPDGSPQNSVVWVARDGDDLLISSQDGRRKVRNIRADPRVSLLVYDVEDPQLYAEIRGTATVSEDVGRAFAVAVEEQYEGPGSGQGYLELPPEVVRVVIRITPTKVAGTAAE